MKLVSAQFYLQTTEVLIENESPLSWFKCEFVVGVTVGFLSSHDSQMDRFVKEITFQV